MIADLIEPLAKLFEPWTGNPETLPDGTRRIQATSGTTVDLNGSEPFTYVPDTLYIWPVRESHDLFESGNPPTEQEHFEVVVLWSAPSNVEEPRQQRTRAVSEAYDAKVHAYLELIRRNRSRYEAGTEAPWQHIAGRVDPDLLRNFNVRGAALRVSGYRFV